jgi:hypothetical protein
MEGMDGTKKGVDKATTEMFLKRLFLLGMTISTHFVLLTTGGLKSSEGENLKTNFSFCQDLIEDTGMDMPHISFVINKTKKTTHDFTEFKEHMISALKFT